MKRILVPAMAIATTTAFAGDFKFNLESRFDLVNAKMTTTGVTEKYNNFANGVVRLNMVGSVNENLSYRFRIRFMKGAPAPIVNSGLGTASSAREESGTQIDYLYVEHKMPWMSLRLGKQNWAEAMGRETFAAATDVFIGSQAFADYKAGAGSDYRAGLSAIFKPEGFGTFTLALSNPNTLLTDNTGTTATNSAIAYGAFYNGSFMDKMIQPVVSYQVLPQEGDSDLAASSRVKKGNFTSMAVGARSEMFGATLDLDYKTFKKANRNDGTNTSAVETTTKSIQANVSYDLGMFVPVVTYVNDKFKSETTTALYKKTSFAVGTYIKPFENTNFRYHVMYTSAKKEADGAGSTVATTKDNRFLVGFKADF